jgi:hypothetical protein
MTGKHRRFLLHMARHIYQKLRPHFVPLTVAAFVRIAEVKVRDGAKRRGIAAGLVIRSRCTEARIPDQGTGRFVIAVVIDRGRRDYEIGLHAAEQFRDTTARAVIVENGQIPEFRADVLSACTFGGGRSLASPDACDLIGRVLDGSAVSWSHGCDGDAVAALNEVQNSPGGKNLHVVRVGVYGQYVQRHFLSVV